MSIQNKRYTIELARIDEYLGSVETGRQTRGRIQALWGSYGEIVCDFENVHGMTGAFADEAFGRMFAEKGARQYADKVRFQNLNDLVRTILKSTLFQRYEKFNP